MYKDDLRITRPRVLLLQLIGGISLLFDSLAIGSEPAKLPVAEGLVASYHFSHDLTERHEQIRRAVIVVHGTLRNAEAYCNRVRQASRAASKQEETLVLAPAFRVRDEAAPHECYWTSSGWKQGDLALNSRDRGDVSSVDVVDRMLLALGDQTRLPNLRHVVILGHSAGGQFVNRYVAAARLDNCRSIDVQFVVMNPSSYLYLTDQRPSAASSSKTSHLEVQFSRYNNYRYGLDNLNSAMQRLSRDQLIENVMTRKCYYFCGEEDVEDEYLDVSPGAMAQGGHRYARFEGYRRHVATYADGRWGENSVFVTVSGAAHNSTEMLADESVQSAVFGAAAQ